MSPSPETGLPAWYDSGNVVLDLDVAALMATGEHPLERVREAVARCAPGEIVALTSGFRPEPLLEVFTRAGMLVWCGLEEGHYRTCICKPR